MESNGSSLNNSEPREKSFAAPDRFQKALRSAVCTNMGLVTLQYSARLDLCLIATAGMDLARSLAVMMPIRTALRLNHRAGCHVPCAVAMVSIRGHSSAIHLYKPIRLRCSMCAPPFFLTLFEETITRNMKMLLFFLTVFSVLAAVLPFISSEIRKTRKTKLTKHYKQGQHFKCDQSLHHEGIHLLFHYTSLIFDSALRAVWGNCGI